MKKHFKIGILAFLLVSIFSCSNTKEVLIIGDSISLGYTPIVQKEIPKNYHIVHNPGNARYAAYGLQQLDKWLGDKKWDIIHFNWGLWDLCYRIDGVHSMNARDREKGILTASTKDYEAILEKIVTRLKQTKARLIFATTTMVPSNEPGRFTKDVPQYNEAALKVMKRHNIEVDPLYELSLEVHPKYGKGEDDVHYKKGGYEIFAKQVIRSITGKK